MTEPGDIPSDRRMPGDLIAWRLGALENIAKQNSDNIITLSKIVDRLDADARRRTAFTHWIVPVIVGALSSVPGFIALTVSLHI